MKNSMRRKGRGFLKPCLPSLHSMLKLVQPSVGRRANLGIGMMVQSLQSFQKQSSGPLPLHGSLPALQSITALLTITADQAASTRPTIQKRPKRIFTPSSLSSIQFISTCHVALEGGPCLQGFTRSKSIAQASSSSSGPGS